MKKDGKGDAQPGKSADPCLVCHALDAGLLYEPTFRGTASDAPGYFLAHRTATAHGRIVRCHHCGFVFTSPRFADTDYDTIYSNIPTPHEGETAFDASKAARFRRLSRIIRYHVPPGATFLDFGCGDGAFLREMNDPEGKGFEIGLPGRHWVGPSEVITGDWASVAGSADAPASGFDFLTAFDVFEHLPRLDEDVAIVRSLIKPGGLLFASVPNVDSLVARVMGKRWNMLLLEHLWYFSPATFRRFLARHGFEEVKHHSVLFDAPIAHIATRLAQQTFGMKGAFVPRGIAGLSLPVPAGIMLGVYRAV